MISVKKTKGNIRIATISSKNLVGCAQENLENHINWIKKAIASGAQFVGFPECSLTGYTKQKNDALSIKGKKIDVISNIAKQSKIYISVGLIEKRHKNYFNSHVVVGPMGLIGAMRKINLTPGERIFLASGKDLPIFNIGTVKLGITICSDSRCFENYRILAYNGAEIIFAPFATQDNPVAKDEKSQKASTFENVDYLRKHFASECCIYFVACNNAGKFKKNNKEEKIYNFSSGAFVINPNGKVINRSRIRDNKEVMIVTDLDLNCVELKRKKSFFFNYFKASFYYGSKINKLNKLARLTPD